MVERHTRQGLTRGQRWGTLDGAAQGDPYVARCDPGSHESTNLAKDPRPAPSTISSRLARGLYAEAVDDWDRYRELRPNTCWCEGALCGPGPDGHITWPGKDEGAPHPRGDRP